MSHACLAKQTPQPPYRVHFSQPSLMSNLFIPCVPSTIVASCFIYTRPHSRALVLETLHARLDQITRHMLSPRRSHFAFPFPNHDPGLQLCSVAVFVSSPIVAFASWNSPDTVSRLCHVLESDTGSRALRLTRRPPSTRGLCSPETVQERDNDFGTTETASADQEVLARQWGTD